jgi:jumonji domain-containing protein 7
MNIMEAMIHMSQESKHLWVPEEIDVIFEISPIDFLRKYVSRNVPCVIKGGCKNWPALNKWTDEYLCSITNKVTVAVTPDGFADAVVQNRFVLPYEQKMTMKEFFNDLYNDKSRVYYIQKQCSSLNLEFPSLVKDCPKLDFADIAFGQEADAVNIWFYISNKDWR